MTEGRLGQMTLNRMVVVTSADIPAEPIRLQQSYIMTVRCCINFSKIDVSSIRSSGFICMGLQT